MTRTIELNHSEIAFIADVGPFPFVCNRGAIHWPEHTDQQVINHMALRSIVPKAQRVILKLTGEIE